jgi:hypothetical protein
LFSRVPVCLQASVVTAHAHAPEPSCPAAQPAFKTIRKELDMLCVAECAPRAWIGVTLGISR